MEERAYKGYFIAKHEKVVNTEQRGSIIITTWLVLTNEPGIKTILRPGLQSEAAAAAHIDEIVRGRHN